jgi:hypothetical protein
MKLSNPSFGFRSLLEFGFGRLPVMNRLVLKVLAGSVYDWFDLA